MKKNEKDPLYQQIANELRAKIMQGKLKPNDPVPNQIELSKLYKISEITSRRALTELVQEGLIYRVRGKGTFVKERSLSGDDAHAAPSIQRIYFIYYNVDISFFKHKFYSDLLVGLQEECDTNGIEFFTYKLGPDLRLPDDANAGYVLITPAEVPLETLRAWKQEQRKIVTVHFYYPHLNIPYVIIDNLTGGYLATEHLLSLGHRRIGIILTAYSQSNLNQEFSLRLEGYRLALSQHGVEFDPSLVCIVEGKEEVEAMGVQGFNQLMDLDQPPTAIFATSDYKAHGAMQAAKDRGMEIPGDISFVGYDDILVSRFTNPGLTTVNQNTELLGKRAAKLLIFDWRDDGLGNLKDEIVPKLIIRNSTEPLNSK
ncbi:GntR family transcriptional regulator [Paenibacillus paridis]|uniref:GntR family transcriptional regulator n=1 Tax=Paenibacillus paridis TaxID=2583376 RepID=UPI001124C2B5|nr:GntR family transcriptional regulator [Paenibacillus paridis]